MFNENIIFLYLNIIVVKRVRKIEKRGNISFVISVCLFVRLYVRPRGITLLPQDGFSYLMLADF